jgi:hypothetical protein
MYTCLLSATHFMEARLQGGAAMMNTISPWNLKIWASQLMGVSEAQKEPLTNDQETHHDGWYAR